MCIRDRPFTGRGGVAASLAQGREAEHGGAEEPAEPHALAPVSYTHLRAHETVLDLVCRLLLEKKKDKQATPEHS